MKAVLDRVYYRKFSFTWRNQTDHALCLSNCTLAIFSGQLLRSLLFTILKHCFQNDKRSRVLKSFVDFCLTNSLGFEDPPVSPTEIQLLHDYKQNQQARPTQPKATNDIFLLKESRAERGKSFPSQLQSLRT